MKYAKCFPKYTKPFCLCSQTCAIFSIMLLCSGLTTEVCEQREWPDLRSPKFFETCKIIIALLVSKLVRLHMHSLIASCKGTTFTKVDQV